MADVGRIRMPVTGPKDRLLCFPSLSLYLCPDEYCSLVVMSKYCFHNIRRLTFSKTKATRCESIARCFLQRETVSRETSILRLPSVDGANQTAVVSSTCITAFRLLSISQCVIDMTFISTDANDQCSKHRSIVVLLLNVTFLGATVWIYRPQTVNIRNFGNIPCA